MAEKPSIPKGSRDFGPDVVLRRQYIINTIRTAFELYGYRPIETPAMENLSTLTGKYGDEGDKLLFRVLNSGDYLAKADAGALLEKDSSKLSPTIASKGLRYDLTVPFARFVVQHQNDITFPFKRYQIQPVWRADRPQRGRYREFYQCDADVVGSNTLVNELELVQITDEVFTNLKMKKLSIHINDRRILAGLAALSGHEELLVPITVAIDKLDKIGMDGVEKELLEKGLSQDGIERIKGVIGLEGSNAEKLDQLVGIFSGLEDALEGVASMRALIDMIDKSGLRSISIDLDISLARGLSYYTGAIFEVSTDEIQIGSVGGGGRYDNLTGLFGLDGVSGVGISFGLDRIYDVLDETNNFPESVTQAVQLLIANFDDEGVQYSIAPLQKIRAAGIRAEMYPASAKLQKQFKYADSLNIPFVAMAGSDEMAKSAFTFKDMNSGEQELLTVDQIISKINS